MGKISRRKTSKISQICKRNMIFDIEELLNIEVKDDRELELVYKKFNTKYSKEYLVLHCGYNKKHIKKSIEQAWENYKLFNGDKHFLSEVIGYKGKTTQRLWELFLGNLFLKNGFTFDKDNGIGPDFLIKDPNIFIEASAPNIGTGLNRVHLGSNELEKLPVGEIVFRSGTIYERDQPKILRITSKIDNKYRDFEKLGIENKPYFLAIYSGLIEGESMQKGALSFLYGLGNTQINIRGRVSYDFRGEVKNCNGTDIPINIFDNDKYSLLTGIIYLDSNFFNDFGDYTQSDIKVFLNPYAKNTVDYTVFHFLDVHKYIFQESGLLKVL